MLSMACSAVSAASGDEFLWRRERKMKIGKEGGFENAENGKESEETRPPQSGQPWPPPIEPRKEGRRRR